MKCSIQFITVLLVVGIYLNLNAQNLDIEGKTIIKVMDDDITTDSIVVLRSGGELARRHVSSLPAKNLNEVLTQNNDAGALSIINLANPINAQDAATKAYVDQLAEILLDAGFNGIVMDIEGNIYKTIKLDTQVWMAENLRTTKYNDGTSIPKVSGGAAWSNRSIPAYCWYANDSIVKGTIYGALYNFYTIADTNSLNVCPTGWDDPTDVEWTALTDFLEDNGYGYEGSGDDIGKSMAATSYWTNSTIPGHIGNNQSTNNSSGIAGLPGGYRSNLGMFFSLTYTGYWWTSTESDDINGFLRHMVNTQDDVDKSAVKKKYGLSVRCIRD